MKALSLFSGIGGLDLAAELCGIETAAFCEIEPFAVKVLERRFPGVPIVDDVRKIRGCDWSVDVVHRGFPCQDLSCAGKQKGLEGERSGLWYEMLRVIAECRPRFVLAENVRGACNLALPAVVSGLEGEGYEVRASVVPASAFGAPHRRERLFVLGVRRDVADSASERLKRLWPARKQESEIHAGTIKTLCGCIGSGELWPTPSVHGNYNRKGLSETSGDGLATAVKLWPTPTSTERSGINHLTGRGGGLTHAVSLWPTPHRNCSNGAGAHGDGGLNIQTAVSLWRTPDANCMRGASSEERIKWKREKGMPISINDQVGKGSLNPAWVEILMGFPIGWTDPDCDEPEPWPGWPAPMNATQNWPTTRACDGIVRHSQNWMHKRVTENRDVDITTAVKTNVKTGQYPYEPPRTCTKLPNRAARLKCLGNAVVPQQAYPFFEAIRIMEEVRYDQT